MKNSVYIGTSLDGYIADRQGGLDWLDSIPNPEGNDMGYYKFMDRVDALVMGRNTFETVCGFDVPWPYTKPVFVLSNSLNTLDPEYQDKAEILSGNIKDILETIHAKGFHNLYIDGGKVIQAFLQEGLIDEMIITRLPILLGGGTPLFGELTNPQTLKHVRTKVLLNEIVQSHYKKLSNA